LLKDQAVHQLTLINGAARLLEDSDVLEIDVIGRLRVDNLHDGIDGHRGKLRLLGDNLGGKRSRSSLKKRCSVAQRDRLRHIVQNVDSSCCCPLERLGNDCRVDSLGQKPLRCSQQAASNNYNGCGTISSLNILSVGEVDEHLSGRVHYAHIPEHGVAVVGLMRGQRVSRCG
jgi:hypothetical protein